MVVRRGHCLNLHNQRETYIRPQITQQDEKRPVVRRGAALNLTSANGHFSVQWETSARDRRQAHLPGASVADDRRNVVATVDGAKPTALGQVAMMTAV